MVGSLLGVYRLGPMVGAGGMGEVYRGTDTRLDRRVAVKVLRPDASTSPDRRRRFEREARAVASLNHPSICTLHDVGVHDGIDYMVMEYVDGETLAHRLEREPLAIDRVIGYGMAIADALAAAHARQITHRDLKPANIMLTKSGLKVLDFGLAKFMVSDSDVTGETEALTVPLTVLGTPAYMAPEQREGKACDARTDIYALGLVLFEMATGRRAVAGTSAATLPPYVAYVIERCLSADPDDRWQSATDVKLALAWEDALRAAGTPARSDTGLPLMRFSVDLGPDAVAGLRTTLTISRDGQRLAFLVRGIDGRSRLATRRLDEAEPTVLEGTEDAQDAFFSPDGLWLGFFADYKLKRVSVRGGAPLVVCEAPNDRGASWVEAETIVLAPHIYGGLVRVAAGGGAPELLTTLQEGDVAHSWPQVLPELGAVLFTGGSVAAPNVQALSLETGRTRVLAAGYRGRYLPTGHVVYVHKRTLFAFACDPSTLERRGVPVPLLLNVADDAVDRAAHFDCAENGTLVYSSGEAASLRVIAWMDRSGQMTPLIDTPGQFSYLAPSPDGHRLTFVSGDDICMLDYRRGRPSRLSLGTTANTWPVWTRDGKHLIFSAQNASGVGRALWWVRADGASEPHLLFESSEELHATSVSPDGTHVAFHQRSPKTRYDIWILPIDASHSDQPQPGAPEAFVRTAANEWGAVFSPDGRWVAYYSEESGTGEIYVRPFRGRGGPWLVSSGAGIAGTMAYWPPQGDALYYLSAERHIMEVTYSGEGNAFVADPPRRWSDTPTPFALFNLSPDADRAIVATHVSSAARKGSLHVHVLLNFFDELRRRAPCASHSSVPSLRPSGTAQGSV